MGVKIGAHKNELKSTLKGNISRYMGGNAPVLYKVKADKKVKDGIKTFKAKKGGFGESKGTRGGGNSVREVPLRPIPWKEEPRNTRESASYLTDATESKT